MAISMDEYTKKYKTQIENNRKQMTNLSKDEVENTYKNLEKSYYKKQNELYDKIKEKGMQSPGQILNSKLALPKYSSNIQNQRQTPQTLLYDSLEESSQKASEIFKDKEIINLRKQRENLYDKTGNAYNVYLNKKLDEDNIGWFDKSVGSAIAGVGSLLPAKYRIKNENGDYYRVKNYSERKQEKIMNSYNSTLGRIYGNVAYELGKIGATTVVNTISNFVVPGSGFAGTALYYGDIFSDSYNRTIEEGYDAEKAMTYATVNTATEYVVGKMLGGTAKALGLGSSELSTSISKMLTDNLLKNHPHLANTLANAVSEGSEEFVQEFLDKFSRSVLLEEKNFKDSITGTFKLDVLKDALYSGLVGSITGGVTGAFDGTDYSIKMPDKINDNITNNNVEKETNVNENLKEEDKITSNNTDIIQNNNNTNNNQNMNINSNSDINSVLSQINELKQLQSNNELNLIQYQELKKLQKQLSVLQEQNQNTEITQNTNNQNNLKEQQNNIIQNTNPVNDDYHTWIRSVDDIKTFSEALNDSDYKEYFEAGENFDETYTADMAKMALETGKITVYSSYPIEQGTFVSPSKMEAESYSGTGKVYSKEVNLTDVAWIDPTQGQYAKVSEDNLQNTLNSNNASYSIPIGKYQYVESDNANINALRKSASIYLNNTMAANNTVSLLESIIKDKNYAIKFNPNITNEQGVEVAGKISKENGQITIELNPNVDNYVEFLVIHEITHDIATKEMKELILDYAKQDSEFNDSLETLKKRYKTDDVSDEIVADVCGELFGNREFIQSVVEKKPNIFKKILNNIRKLAEKIKGTGANEYVNFVEKLKTMWEDAYYSNQSNLNTTMFSIQQDSKGNKYVKADRKVLTGNNPLLWETQIEQYINDKIRNNEDVNVMAPDGDILTITKDTAGKAKFRNYYIDKNGNKHYMKNNEFYTKLSAEAHIDELGSVSKKINKKLIPDYKSHSFAKDGFNYRTAFFEDFNGDYYKLTMSVGKNGNINTIYNVGKLEQRKRPVISGSSVNNGASGSLTINNISQPNINVKSDTSTKYSIPTKEWNTYLKDNFPSSGTKTKMNDIVLPMSEEVRNSSKNKTLNPIEISQLKPEDANTTPFLPGTKRNTTGDGESKFYDNIKDKTDMLNEEQKGAILSSDEVKYYDKITNKESLNEAFSKLEKGGQLETNRWFKKESKDATATDVAEGWILLKQYADKSQNTTDLIEKNYYNEAMVEIAKKMRDIGTKAGQTVQAFNIMERMSPEGMVKYAQSELSEAYNKMVQGKTKEWIDKYRNNFELTADDVQFIMDTMQEVSTMEDGYDKKVKLAQIQKLMTDKLPPQRGAKIKSWMRISMLFNLKTQVRNVAGNALIMPVNAFGDLFSSYTDKIIAKKTGVRTTGNTNIKAMLKGMKRGAYEATNDYKMGINTKDMEGNRFEISDGKSFSDKNIVGKTLNRTESLLNYVMDVGDRVFSEASFENSLQNQMILNGTTEITQEMIDIAHQEALSRTWNDNNNYTKFVLNARSGLNQLLNFKGYGLGDVLIPFAKTPANLTKAIVEYSPVGLVSTLKSGINLNRSLTNGQYTAQMQHDFVQKLGKATAGTMLYVLGVALAKAGITSGESDDDKDTRNFLQNALGISSYSIKIGDKTFTYDWAQPLAAPLSITANVVNSNSNKETALLEAILGSLDTAGAILLEQSFLQSINDVLTDNDGFVSGLITEILELPARAIPTFSKQIADMVDGTKRQTFEYDKPIKSAYNYAKSKIPGLSKTLAPSVDTMGREIQKYGGKNNIFNVFLNPANVNTENISESAKEIYRLYEETGDTTIMPRVAPYYVKKGEKITLNSTQRAEYQKISGKIIEDSIQALLKNSQYKNMSDVEKADIVKDIVDYSYNVAQSEVLDTEISSTFEKAYLYSKVGNVYDYYIFKSQEFTSDKDKNGKTISGSKKKKIIKYINSMNISAVNKAILIKFNNYSVEGSDKKIINYINSQNLTKEEKSKILTELGYTIKNGKVYIK